MHPHIFFPSVAVAPSVHRWTNWHLHKHFRQEGKGPSGRWSALRLRDRGFNPSRVTPQTTKRTSALGIKRITGWFPSVAPLLLLPAPSGDWVTRGEGISHAYAWRQQVWIWAFTLKLELQLQTACAVNSKRKYESGLWAFIRMPGRRTRSDNKSFRNYFSVAACTGMAKWANLITKRSPKVSTPKRSEVKKRPVRTSIIQRY